ncbi:MAG: Lrp/AsnC family transcriptional regulator [Arachnia propionica]|uniref:Lrp/AsnC family transcriptional regulator n=1 Tax=Arachnia propionica TaxID=1750 RepID=UPI00270C3B8C|nr:Lrp/AsnC family transcriptional regulator [Arachnia propionica]
MQEETDLRLVNLLQIDPRMSWARAAEILQVSPTTVASHWQRLHSHGLAWISTHPNPENRFTAIVDVDCRTEHLPSVIEQLCAHPLITSVDETTGRRDILLTVMAPSMHSLTTLIIDWIGGLEGVYGTRSSLVTNVITGAESWRLNVLAKRQSLQARPQLLPDQGPRELTEVDLALADALVQDGRASVASLAEQLDMPTSTVQRRLKRMLSDGSVVMRCDVAPELAGWLLECTWLATVPIRKTRVIELLKEQPGLRSCMWVTGRNNLRINFRVNYQGALGALESRMAAAIPELNPDETIVHLRSHKSAGRILDPEGRATKRLVAPLFGDAVPVP